MADEVLIRLPRAQVAGFDPETEQVGLAHAGADLIILRRQKALLPGEQARDYLRLFGNTRAISVANLFHSLNLSHATGTVVFEADGIRREVYLRNGEIVFAQSNQNDDRLGESLIRAGKLTQEQLDEAARSITASRKLGQILVEDGLISPKELFIGVRHQVEEICWTLFDWPSKYAYFEGFTDPDAIITLHLDTQKLIVNGLRRSKAWEQIPHNAPEREIVIQLSANPKNLRLNQEEQRLAALIVTGVSLRELIEQSGLGLLETYKVTSHMLEREVIIVGIRGKQPAPAPANDVIVTVNRFQDVFDQIFRLIESRAPGAGLVAKVNSFFDALPDELLAVFGTVRFADDAQLDADQIAANVDAIGNQGRAHLLKAFNEVLYFVLFESKNVISDEDSAEIMAIIENMDLF